jgi:hypothetical protein
MYGKERIASTLVLAFVTTVFLTGILASEVWGISFDNPRSGFPVDTWDQVDPNGGDVLSLPPGVDIPLGGTNEPTVAVNTTNPMNVAHASLFQLSVSNDGGGTWLPAVSAVVPGTHILCGDPSLAYDSQGRLFWTYLGCRGNGIDIFVAQVNPATGAILAGYPVNITAQIGLPAPNFAHDKEWLAADYTPASPFADNLYVVWSEFTGPQPTSTRILTTSSADQGVTWSAAVQLSGVGEGFVWPCHNTVAPNGDVYVAYHSQPTFTTPFPNLEPDGISGQVFVLRSTDGGVSYPQKTLAFSPGAADITFNYQTAAGAIPGTQFWLQGSAQPWIMADPITPGRIYVVANDDPDNNHTTGDPANVYIAISADNGLNWLNPSRIDSGPDTTFQVMPTAAIDKESGCIVAHYYDNRNGNTNASGRFLLDVFTTSSSDGGVTFIPDFAINDNPFDPDPGAPIRFFGPPPTRRIGEYNGVDVGGGDAFYVWCGNTVDTLNNPIGQQTIFDSDTTICITCDDIVDPPEVRTQGFWRRVCKKPHPEEPNGVDPYAADAIALGSPLFDGFDADSICALMAVSPPENDMCRKARRQFMALLLNLASGRVGLCNCIDSGLTTAGTVEEVVAEIIALLSGSPDHATCVLAKSLAAEINEGSSLIPCSGPGNDTDPGNDEKSRWDKTIEEGLIETSLAQNIPNPFPNTTDILYMVKGATDSRSPSILSEGLPEKVILRVYDLAGREVKTLVDDDQETGIYRITWDGKNQRGEDLSSGIYFYQIKIGDLTATRKMVLLR